MFSDRHDLACRGLRDNGPDLFGCSSQRIVVQMGISLSRGDLLVPKQTTNDVETDACAHKSRGVIVPQVMRP
jgi:hypothetical protein